MLRKSIVLSDVHNSNKKAVLSISSDNFGTSGTLRLYNFPHEPSGVLSLGLYNGQKVLKAGLTKKSQMLYEFYINQTEIPAKFSCAIVNFQNAVARPLLFGSSEGSKDDVYGSIITELSADSSLKNTQEVLDKYNVDFVPEEEEEIEQEIDKFCDERCANCIYKKHFYEQNSETEKTFAMQEDVSAAATKTLKNVEKIENEQKSAEKEQKIAFFDRLKPQIDKIFESNPAENALQEIFPTSKWARVEYEDEGDFFVFGLLYDDDGQVKYVCYGVPAVSDEKPPEELEGYPIWLPLDDEGGFGYWMTYQDATTGEPIKAILD